MANVLLVAERQGRIDEAKRIRALELLLHLPIQVMPIRASETQDTMRAAASHDLSAYNGAYLHLAMRQGHL